MSWLSDDEIAAVVREATDVLDGIGMRMSGSRALEALAAAGGRVEGDVVHFPAKLVLEAVAQCPRVVTMAGETSDVGNSADSEGNGRARKTRKCPYAGEKLEAAAGVEPAMEILQSSVGGEQE